MLVLGLGLGLGLRSGTEALKIRATRELMTELYKKTLLHEPPCIISQPETKLQLKNPNYTKY